MSVRKALIIPGKTDKITSDAQRLIRQDQKIKNRPKSEQNDEDVVRQLEQGLGPLEIQKLLASTDVDQKQLKLQFNAFLDSATPVVNKRFFRDVVLVQIFKFVGDIPAAEVKESQFNMGKKDPNEPKKTFLSKKVYDDRIYPVAKVLAVGSADTVSGYGLQAGCIIELNDSISNFIENPEFDTWVSEKSGESGGIVGIDNAPPRMVKGFDEYKKFVYKVDKFSASIDDTILLLPKELLKTDATEHYMEARKL